MGLEYIVIQMEQSTRDNGKMTSKKVMGLRHGQMELDMKDFIKKEKKMGKVLY